MSTNTSDSATPTVGEMPEMRPSAQSRMLEAIESGPLTEMPDKVQAQIERAYRDGYQAALSTLSPLIEAARRDALEEAARTLETSEDRHTITTAAAMIRALSTFSAPASPWRPAVWLAWAHKTFGDIAFDPRERALRFIEEAIEVAHAMGLDETTLSAIIARVYFRQRGDLAREIGQSMGTLELLAETMAINAEAETAAEFQRVQSIPQEEWDRRHAAKVALGIALPVPPSTTDRGE